MGVVRTPSGETEPSPEGSGKMEPAPEGSDETEPVLSGSGDTGPCPRGLARRKPSLRCRSRLKYVLDYLGELSSVVLRSLLRISLIPIPDNMRLLCIKLVFASGRRLAMILKDVVPARPRVSRFRVFFQRHTRKMLGITEIILLLV